MTHKPRIGILLDWQDSGTFSRRSHYALRDSYFNAISNVGGMGVGMPYIEQDMADYIDMIDGLLCPGGDYETPADWYVEGELSPYSPSPRAKYEVQLIRRTLEAGKPVLGICGGMQVMAAAFGAKLTGNLHKYFETDIDHKNGVPAEDFAYPVKIAEGSHLHRITGVTEMRVNTAHSEAVVEGSERVTIIAHSHDNCPQAIEVAGYDFALGVQWHPEFFVKDDKGEPGHRKLFEALLEAASARQKPTKTLENA